MNELVAIGQEGEVILYQPDEKIKIEVKVDMALETVWLTQAQMAELFNRDRTVITKHIGNIFREGELDPSVVCANFALTTRHGAMEGKTQTDDVMFYNLDVVISVGYRVKSRQGTLFRIWATRVLRDYLLRGCAFNRQLQQMEQRIDGKLLAQHDQMEDIKRVQAEQGRQLEFFIKTGTPPAEMVFYNGQFFEARVAIENLIKTARSRAIIIDHYVDARTFDVFDVRQAGVDGIIYTMGVGPGMKRLKAEHDRQKDVQPVDVRKWRVEPHDRFMVIDNRLYHCGHSLNATGEKLSSIMLMGASPESILREME